MFLQKIKSVLLRKNVQDTELQAFLVPTMYNMEVFEEELIAGTVVPVKTLRNFHGPQLGFIFLEDFYGFY